MIVVTGSVTARQDSLDEALRLSLEHVRRSRQEAGCISHAVHVDCENPLRLVFFEQWADRAALLDHFAVPASRQFVKTVGSSGHAAGHYDHLIPRFYRLGCHGAELAALESRGCCGQRFSAACPASVST